MSITDEQVRVALGVWFEEDDYAAELSATSHSMRSMRAALEAAVGGVAAESGGWSTYCMTFEHPAHGMFWVYPGRGAGYIYASRCYLPAGASNAVSEAIAADLATLADAQAAVRARIAELDAALADTAPALQVAQ